MVNLVYFRILVLFFWIGAGCSVTLKPAVLTKFRNQALARHNVLRAKHGVPKLALTKALNTYAQKYCVKIAASDTLVHSGGPYGENLYYSTGTVTGAMPVDAWYNEIAVYDFANPGFSLWTGHFTQVVWKNTKTLGIGVAKSKTGKTYVCANYSPPGNYEGQFEANVLPLLN